MNPSFTKIFVTMLFTWLATQIVNRIIAKFFKRPIRIAEEKAEEAASALGLA